MLYHTSPQAAQIASSFNGITGTAVARTMSTTQMYFRYVYNVSIEPLRSRLEVCHTSEI